MLKKEPEIINPPKIVGSVGLVMCKECKTIQDWESVLEKDFCTAVDLRRGWSRCPSKEFLEVEVNGAR